MEAPAFPASVVLPYFFIILIASGWHGFDSKWVDSQTSYRNIGSLKKSKTKKQEPTSPCRADECELESLDLGLDVPRIGE